MITARDVELIHAMTAAAMHFLMHESPDVDERVHARRVTDWMDSRHPDGEWRPHCYARYGGLGDLPPNRYLRDVPD
jgi:hypothetical protein